MQTILLSSACIQYTMPCPSTAIQTPCSSSSFWNGHASKTYCEPLTVAMVKEVLPLVMQGQCLIYNDDEFKSSLAHTNKYKQTSLQVYSLTLSKTQWSNHMQKILPILKENLLTKNPQKIRVD